MTRATAERRYGRAGLRHPSSLAGERQVARELGQCERGHLPGGRAAGETYTDPNAIVTIGQYDDADHLTRVRRKSDSAVLGEYGHNALGWRAKKVVSNSGDLNGTWRLVYNAAWQLLETRTVSGPSQTTHRQFVHAGPAGEPDPQRPVVGAYIDAHVAMLDPAANGAAARHYYHADALYNTMALSDANGNVTRKVLYDPYGLATVTDGNGNPVTPGSDGNPFLRQGIIRDSESGNDDSRHRWYSLILAKRSQRFGLAH